MRYTFTKWARKVLGLKKIHAAIMNEAGFKKGDAVIDVGCGTGMLLEEIHKIYGDEMEYMGIEPDENVRQIAERKHGDKGIKFKRAFANHLPSVQDYYSHVICMVSFHHFPREEWKASLEELKRVLKPGGKLIIVEFGSPTNIIGTILHFINPCRKLSSNIEGFMKSTASEIGLIKAGEKKQFGYISHLIFTK